MKVAVEEQRTNNTNCIKLRVFLTDLDMDSFKKKKEHFYAMSTTKCN